MRISAMFDILSFALALLVMACIFDGLALQEWFYFPFALGFIGLIIFMQIGKRRFKKTVDI